MSKTMAEVLAEHRDIAWDHTTGRSLCGGCDATLGQLTADIEKQDAWLIAHQAAALSAAGFGLVTDAKAEALEEAAGDFTERVAATRSLTRDNGTPYAIATLNHAYGMEMASTALRARAAALRGDS